MYIFPIRTIFFCLLSFFVASSSLLAQDDEDEVAPTVASGKVASRFRAGVFGGINLSQIEGDGVSGYKKIGLNAGLTTSYRLHKHWSINLEMAYSEKGSFEKTYDQFECQMNYIEVPVYISFHDWVVATNKNRYYSRVKANAGLAYGRLLNGKVTNNLTTLPDEDFEATFRKNDFSIVLGAAFYFSPEFSFDFRWVQSLIGINTISTIGPANNIYNNAWIHNTISFRLMYVLSSK